VSSLVLALLGSGDGGRGKWALEEIEIEAAECETIDDLANVLRDFAEPIRLLAIEQDDEYAAIVRLDVDADEADEPTRVFLSNGRAADDYPLAEVLADGLDEIGGDPLDGDTDAPEGVHDVAPFGDAQLLSDLGVSGGTLVELAVREGALPMDLIEAVCERLGCLGQFEAIRG
jgi:putative tRNA adenosine deaminase-associated protein